ncbi:MAG: hypothetical protein HQ517_02425 [SAR324 cluster bacterium]|nr:hypothetical protein [SAR324 cluster bacterium]
MNQFLCQHVEHLKSALLSLPATGEKGFEGLIGATLHEISGVSFRLASSGLQFGIDGKPTYEGNAICFEGKRYKDSVPRSEVLSKIAELSIYNTETDIWVLGATSKINSQLADAARKLGAKAGIFVLILDWSAIDLPPFAVSLAMGGTRVQEFLANNISDDKTFQEAIAALEAIRNSQDFALHSDRIRTQCNGSSVGWTLAQRANTDWLSDAFSSRKRAKMKLGQPLSPGDTDRGNVRKRRNLTDKLSSYLTTASDETVVCILGGEGNGKSWVVAQSWIELAQKPLMVFMSSDDFAKKAEQNDFVGLLITKLIKQTGDRVTESTLGRWRRRLEQWRRHYAIDGPRLIVVIDGINQRPKTDWARIIESIFDELNQLNGRLIVTARMPYFQDRVKGRLSVSFNEISIPEWTATERDEIIAERGIETSDIHHSVMTSLLNPRLLGIALELLNNDDITNFDELSISRLLFEHMRTSERDAPVPQTASGYARQLQKHAQEIISRIKANHHDDLKIFEDELGLVADGRFYQTVDGDPTRCSLKDDGLTLALGFSVIDRLRTAKRNHRSLDDELDVILEPILALDDTANVVIAALTVKAVKEFHEHDIATSLVKGFAMLQNPDHAKFLAFTGLVKNMPQAFMEAAHGLSLEGGHQPNFDWIQGALIIASQSKQTWQEMVENVSSWLSFYSLSSKSGSFSHPMLNSQEQIQKEGQKNRKKIEEKLYALSANERTILEKMPKKEGNLNNLSRLALLLLAGKSLAPFAKSLLNWSFSNALNSDQGSPYKEFKHLVSLNRVDWAWTRAALLGISSPLREADVSKTGKWALLNILLATGHSEDGKKALSIWEDLTKDRPCPEGWRLNEKYCATDPCDPTSEQPENLTPTTEKYTAIDVSKLNLSLNQSSEDHFFDLARPSIARFKPDVAVAKHKEFAMDVIKRAGFPLKQGLLGLRQHNALLTINEARELTKKRNDEQNIDMANGLSTQNEWIVSQYRLLLAFPFFSAREQSEILLLNEEDGNILIDLMDLAKTLDEKEFESILGSACEKNNEHNQYSLLMLGNYTSVPLSARACTLISKLFRSKSDRVRTQALGIIAQSGDEDLLHQVVQSDWTATDIKTENDYEVCYGSAALLEAAKMDLLTHNKALNRISAGLYGKATAILNMNAIHDIARRIDVSINHVVGLDSDLIAPNIELHVHPSTLYDPSRFSISEQPSGAKSINELKMWLSESNETAEQHHRHNYEAFLEFKTKLTQTKASIILDSLSLEEFTTLVETAEELADRWHGLFMSIADAKLPAVHNLVLLLAHALGRNAPDKSEELFCRVKESKPLVRITFGNAGIQLDAMATWAGVSNPILDNLRFERLDHASNDFDLSIEVLCTLLNGQHQLLTTYIEAKLQKNEPAEISRGIMVAGFSNQSEFNDEVLKKYENSAGLIGSAYKAAKYAYERNVWAQHWFQLIYQTDENTAFWRYAALFLKIVDGRFSVWRLSHSHKGGSIKLFGSTLDGGIKNRIAKWKNHRIKKLFGSDAPDLIFLEGENVKD